MTTVTTEQVQHELPELLARVRRGETLLIEENGQEVGKLVPPSPAPRPIRLGSLEGKFTVPDDFDEMMRDEIEEMFYGKP